MSEPIDKRLVDDAFDAYLDWREEAAGVWEAYERWDRARVGDGDPAFFSAYRAALEREERASQVYAGLVTEITARTSGAATVVVTAPGIFDR